MLNPQQLCLEISKLVGHRAICVAYSGGVDSHVLLHMLSNASGVLQTPIRAIHIDHGLQSAASHWAQHCADVCRQLGILLEVIQVQVDGIAEQGLEAAAREARYQAIQSQLRDDEVLLTAQHQQDQAETLLLQLFRGAGPTGLAAMRQQTELFGMSVIRPLLSVSREQIETYARQHQLNWIEDPSNSDTQINRNFIRHRLWPVLEQRWPSAAKTLSRSAQHCDEASEILLEVAAQDAQLCMTEHGQLMISCLLDLSFARLKNVLRFLIEQKQLPLPSAVVLQKIIDELCLAKSDAMPLINWPGAEVRRYQDLLYFQQPSMVNDAVSQSYRLDKPSPLKLADGRLLKWRSTLGEGLNEAIFQQGCCVRFRQGGERICLQGQSQHKTLKHLFQQWQIAPWQRTDIPLIFVGNELVAIVGYGYAEGYVVGGADNGWIPYIDD